MKLFGVTLALVSLLLTLAVSCSTGSTTTRPNANNIENPQEPSSDFELYSSLGFYICGGFLPNLPFQLETTVGDADGVTFNISHQNGVATIAPTSQDLDAFATMGTLGVIAGFDLSDTSLTIKYDDGSITYNEAEGCDGKPSNLSITRWQVQEISEAGEFYIPEVFTTSLSQVSFEKKLEAYTISFLPLGSDIPPLPLSTLELIALEEVSTLENLPTPEELELVPARSIPPPAGTTITADPTPCPSLETIPPRVTEFSHSPANCLDISSNYTAIFKTNMGDIYVELDTATYNTTNAFVLLARYQYYDGSALFRTDPAQGIIQGGAVHLNRVDDPGPGFFIPDEQRFFNYGPGQLIMARNSSPNSAKGQFVFTVNEKAERLEISENLAVFGEVTQGLDILERILSLHVNDPLASEESVLFLGGPIFPVIVDQIVIVEEPR